MRLLQRLFGGGRRPRGEPRPDDVMGRRHRGPVHKVVVGLGNPGPNYDATRHNVGWWVVDRLAADWGDGTFSETGPLLSTVARVGGHEVLLAKPLTYMNRSGLAVRSILEAHPTLDPAEDLLVVVDDATREVGGVRFRPEGGSGGHRGLRSISDVLEGDGYPRLRVGVGQAPKGADLAQWVLSPMPSEDEAVVVDLLPWISEAVHIWVEEGTQAAMNRFNR